MWWWLNKYIWKFSISVSLSYWLIHFIILFLKNITSRDFWKMCVEISIRADFLFVCCYCCCCCCLHTEGKFSYDECVISRWHIFRFPSTSIEFCCISSSSCSFSLYIYIYLIFFGNTTIRRMTIYNLCVCVFRVVQLFCLCVCVWKKNSEISTHILSINQNEVWCIWMQKKCFAVYYVYVCVYVVSFLNTSFFCFYFSTLSKKCISICRFHFRTTFSIAFWFTNIRYYYTCVHAVDIHTVSRQLYQSMYFTTDIITFSIV